MPSDTNSGDGCEDPRHIRVASNRSLADFIRQCNASRRLLGFPLFDLDRLSLGSPRRRFQRLFQAGGVAVVVSS